VPEDLDSFLEEEHRETLFGEALACVQSQVEARTWEALHLQTYGGKSGKEVSEQLGMPLTAVFMAKSCVQSMLREEVQRLTGKDS
jgi:RNA polymerase sigma-70 factor (ECF subfamily)